METERLEFKFYQEKDKKELIALFTDERVMKYVGDGVMTEEQAEVWWRKLFDKFYPQNLKIWAIFDKSESHYIGHAAIYPRPTSKKDWEFVYFLKREEWGKGYATEIARGIVEFGIDELKLTEIFATVDNDHQASIRVLEKAGLRFLREEYDKDGSYSVYSIKKTETADLVS